MNTKPLLPAFTRRLAVLHRWLGMALCLWIALWLVTGSVLSFVPFPTLPEAARVAGGEPLDTRLVRVAPVEALAVAGMAPLARVRLVSVLGQPRYLLTPVAGPAIAVDALHGGRARSVTADQAAAIAQRFAGAPVRSVAGPLQDDQWTVHDGYAAYRPMWRVALADPAGTEIYVVQRTGEVVQRTQRRERAWNYVGAIVHWLNAVPLRRHYQRWHDVVWVLALTVAVLLLCGLTLGTLRTASLRRARGAGVSPFRGVQRWHHLAGFAAGVALLAWVTTGWLSLDADTLFSPEQPGPVRIERLRGMPLAQAAEGWSTASLASFQGARVVEFGALGGETLLSACGGPQAVQPIPDARLRAAVEAAWAPARVLAIAPIGADDAYRLRGTPLPDTARRLVLDDARRTWVQMDAADGRVLSVLDARRRAWRWLFDGWHRMDLPFLRVGGIWHALLLLLTGTCLAFVGTASVLAWRRLSRMLR